MVNVGAAAVTHACDGDGRPLPLPLQPSKGPYKSASFIVRSDLQMHRFAVHVHPCPSILRADLAPPPSLVPRLRRPPLPVPLCRKAGRGAGTETVALSLNASCRTLETKHPVHGEVLDDQVQVLAISQARCNAIAKPFKGVCQVQFHCESF